MQTVYQSLGRPVFTGVNETTATDAQDYSYISSALTTATNNTNTLKAKDHVTILMGTTWLHSVTSASNEYQAMQQYISDSETFLSDYKTLLIYTEQINQVGEIQMPPLLNDFNQIFANDNNPTAFLADLQQTTTDLQNFTNQVKSLKPSVDLVQFNDDLLTDLSGMNNSLQGLTLAFQGNISQNISDLQAELQTATDDFATLANSNPFTDLQTSSTIHNQITTLEGEHPLQ